MRHSARHIITFATMLALLAGSLTAVPASAAPNRYPSLEKFALKLANCTRTGGWIKPNGTCKGYGTGRFSRYVPPLKVHPAIANRVAWPYAATLAKKRRKACHHSWGGAGVDKRFRLAGFKNPVNGENLGCHNSLKPRGALIWAHRIFQREKSWRGSHWRQLKDRDFKSVGVGVARLNGRTTVVYDFYGKVALADR
jgi:hypothetical protein